MFGLHGCKRSLLQGLDSVQALWCELCRFCMFSVRSVMYTVWFSACLLKSCLRIHSLTAPGVVTLPHESIIPREFPQGTLNPEPST